MTKLADMSHFSPKPHQVRGIKYLLKNDFCILGDDMGLGKSFQFISNVLKRQQRAIICCPAYLRDNWENELDLIVKRPEDRELFSVTSYSKSKTLIDLIMTHSPDIIGFDEAHYLKNIEAKRTDSTLEALEEHGFDNIVLMSGTPIKNRIPEWYVLLMICHYHLGTDFLDRFPNEWVFKEYFCKKRTLKIKGKSKNKRGFRVVTQYFGVRNRKELLSYIRPVMLRRLAIDVLDLNKPNHIYIQAKASSIHDKDLLEAFETGKDSAAKRKSALAKVDFTAKYLKDMESPFIMFSCHPEVCEQIAEKLGEEFGVITGNTPVGKRQAIVNGFQEGRFKGLLLSIGAASTGYNMTRASHVIFNDKSYVVGDNAQAVARANRIGQENVVTVHHIGGSLIDTGINKTIVEKMKDLERGM